QPTIARAQSPKATVPPSETPSSSGTRRSKEITTAACGGSKTALAASQSPMWPVPSLAAVPTHPQPPTYMIWVRTSAVRPSSLRNSVLRSLTERIRSADEGDLRSVTPGDESLHQSIDANPAGGDGASHRGEAGRLR